MDADVEITNLSNLAQALATAVQMGFMNREHAATIWKTYLKSTKINIGKEGGGLNDIT